MDFLIIFAAVFVLMLALGCAMIYTLAALHELTLKLIAWVKQTSFTSITIKEHRCQLEAVELVC